MISLQLVLVLVLVLVLMLTILNFRYEDIKMGMSAQMFWVHIDIGFGYKASM